MKNKRAWTVGAVLMALALGGAVLSIRQDRTGADAALRVPSAVEASAPGVAAPSRPTLPSSTASAPEPALATASPTDTLSPRARRMRDDWCGYGMSEALRDAQAMEARSAAARKAGRSQEEEARESDAAQVLGEAYQERLRAWIGTLRARSDLRSHAIADLLADDEPSKTHLQDLARRSTDPMVTALALMRPCQAPGCRPIDAAQWSRLEPDNLMAWVAQLQGGPVPPEQLSYLMERMARDAQRADDYLATLSQVLSSLATGSTGLQQMAEVDLMSSQMAMWPVAKFHGVVKACSSTDVSPARRASCERIAELLWSLNHQLGRAISLTLARSAVPPGHPSRESWEQRARHYDAAAEALMAENLMGMERLAASESGMSCQTAAGMHAELRRTMRISEWDRAEQALAASKESVEDLVERARVKRGGHSPLDEPPPRRPPASGPTR